MLNITLKQLRYFNALAQERHFGRAAEASSVTQPALSLQIKELEQTLQMQLFERSPRKLRLTPFGEAFLDRVEEIMQSLEGLEEMSLAARGGTARRLRLGVIPTIAPYLLPRIVSTVSDRFEGMDLQVRESTTPRLVEELGDGRIDCALVALPISESSFEEVALAEEPMLLVRPITDANKPVPSIDALRDLRLLLLEEGHCFRDQALSFCNVPSTSRWRGLAGSSLSTLTQMVAAGLGVTLIPQLAVDLETRFTEVDVCRFPDPQPTRTIGLIWRKSSPLKDQLNGIAELIRTAIVSKQPTGQVN